VGRIELRTSEGEARLAGLRVAIVPAGEGLRLPEAGVTLRALRFGERSRLVRTVAEGENRPGALARVVAEAAGGGEVGAGRGGDLSVAAVILAMHLAGAGSGAPGFAEEVGLLGRWIGWSPREIDEAEAAEVDALALAYGAAGRRWSDVAASAEEGWVSFVLDGEKEEPEPGDEEPAVGLRELRDALARDLLLRARAVPDPEALLGVPPRAPGAGTRRRSPAASGPALPGAEGPAEGRGWGEAAPEASDAAPPPGQDRRGPESSGDARGREGGGSRGHGATGPERLAPGGFLPPVSSPAADGERGKRGARGPGARGEVGRAWTPVEVPGPVAEALVSSELPRAYPAIFGAGAGGDPSGPGDAGVPGPGGGSAPGGARSRAEAGTRAAGTAGGTEAGTVLTRREGAAGSVRTQAGDRGAGGFPSPREVDVDGVAEALHRAADLRGLAP